MLVPFQLKRKSFHINLEAFVYVRCVILKQLRDS